MNTFTFTMICTHTIVIQADSLEEALEEVNNATIADDDVSTVCNGDWTLIP